MSDALYLSLWYPNLRLEALPDKLVAVLGEFAKHGGEALVYSATVWPVNWSESPVFQQVYGRRIGRLSSRRAPPAPNRARPSNKPLNCSTRTTPTNSRSAGICGR